MMQPIIGDNHPRAANPLAGPITKRRSFGKLVVAQGMMELTR